MSLAIGIDLGGTNLKSVILDQSGKVLARDDQPVTDSAPETVITEMEKQVTMLTERAGHNRDSLVGVGVGSPGPLSQQRGIVYRAANLPGWIDVPLQKELQHRVGKPVILENDGNAAAFGEYLYGAGRGAKHMVMLTLGTGVGAGVIIDGKILHGHFENAAELGHMIVAIDGLPCSCGQRGCLEQYAAAGGVARRAGKALGGTIVRAEDVVTRTRDGDVTCERIWDEACQYLSLACINIQHAFNPERIILGGGMSNAGNLLIDRVKKHVSAMRWSLLDDIPEIHLADLGSDAGAIGAAGLIWRSC